MRLRLRLQRRVLLLTACRDRHPVGACPYNGAFLDVEADVEHVAVEDDVVLAFEPLVAPPDGLCT